VHSISFSENGERLVWVGHDSSVSIVDAANRQQLVFAFFVVNMNFKFQH